MLALGDSRKPRLPIPELHNGRDRNIWPEQLYRYVQHYFWEPQHLLKTPKAAWRAGQKGETTEEAFYRLIRRQEVPLNFTLNLVLRVAPVLVRTAFLQEFGRENDHLSFESPQLLFADDQAFTQPDVLLRTESQRIFVELKVKGGGGSTDQVEKYAWLHAYLDQVESPLEPYLYFLTSGPIERAWKPKKDRAPILQDGLQSFLTDELERRRFSSAPRFKEKWPLPEEAYFAVVNSMRVGHATWQVIGDCLQRERGKRLKHGGEIAEVMRALLGDFLVDLRARHLWKP